MDSKSSFQQPAPGDLAHRKKRFRLTKWFAIHNHRTREAVIAEFADTTSTHGIGRIHKYLYAGSHIMFWFWLAAFGVCAYFCADGIATQVMLYRTKPVTTSISLTVPTEMPFPDIMFCPLVPYRKQEFLAIAAEVGIMLPDQNYYNDDEIGAALEALLNAYPDESILVEKLKSAAFPFADIFVWCTFGTHDCSITNFTLSFGFSQGICGTFSTNYTQLRPGKNFGAFFTFWLGVNTALYNNFHNDEAGLGMYVVIGDKKDNLPLTKSFLTAPSTQVLFHLTRTDYEDNTSKSTCHNVPDNTRYSPQTCFSNCVYNYKQSMCGCNEVTCVIDDCFNSKNLTSEAGRACLAANNCSEPCQSTKYSVQTSFSAWPNEPWLDRFLIALLEGGYCGELVNNTYTAEDFALCKELVGTSLAAVAVAFPEFSYTTVTQTNDFTLNQLMSQVGGLTGLFIGSSFLSMVEAFEVVFLLILVSTVRTKNLVKQVSSSMSRKFIRNPQGDSGNSSL